MAAANRKPQRTLDLAQIHLGAKQIGIDPTQDRQTYEAMLKTLTGLTSTADMDWRQRQLVIEHLKARGASIGYKRARGPNDPQISKARALWGELAALGAVRDGSERALRAFSKRQTGVESLEWLNGRQASNLIEALKAMLARVDAAH